MKQPLRLFALFLLVSISPVLAQTAACPDIVEAALAAVDEFCEPTARNQACFGNVRLDATPQASVSEFIFEQTGDIVSVSDIQTLRLYPMDETSSTWGVVMMRLQANLPDTLPGQNVTFLLFGDVELTSAVTEENSDEYTPMQAFYLATGLGDSQCAEAPESGLVVQTPDGVGEVAFNVNGVDISMGSTVQFQAQRGGEMNVRTLEGAASLTFDGESQPILAGSEIRLPLDQDLRPQGPPPPPVPYDAEHLPPNGIIGALDRPIEFAPPLAEGDIQQAQQMIAQGQPPCDDDPNTPFPTCDHIPSNIGGAPCTFNPEAHPDRPVCNPPEVGGDGRPCVMPPGPNDPPLPETETRPFCETGPDGLPAGTPPAGGQPPLRATRLPQLTPPAGGTPPLPSGGTLLPPPPGGLPPPPPPPGG